MCSEGWAQQSKIRDGSARWGPYGEGCQLIWCVASGTGHPGRFFIIKECLFGPYRWGGWYILLFILATWLWKIPAWCWSRFKEPPDKVFLRVHWQLVSGIPGRLLSKEGTAEANNN